MQGPRAPFTPIDQGCCLPHPWELPGTTQLHNQNACALASQHSCKLFRAYKSTASDLKTVSFPTATVTPMQRYRKHNAAQERPLGWQWLCQGETVPASLQHGDCELQHMSLFAGIQASCLFPPFLSSVTGVGLHTAPAQPAMPGMCRMRRGLTAGGLGTEQLMSHLEGWQQTMNPWTSEPKVSPNLNPCEKQPPSNPQLAGCSEPVLCWSGGSGAEGLALGVETERCFAPQHPELLPREWEIQRLHPYAKGLSPAAGRSYQPPHLRLFTAHSCLCGFFWPFNGLLS